MRIFPIIFFLLSIILMNSETLAETKKDCEKYNKNTLLGGHDYRRCMKGKDPVELGNKIKRGLNKFNILKKN